MAGTPMFKVTQKLKRLKCVLKKHNGEGFSDLQATEVRSCQVLRDVQALIHQNPADLNLRRREKGQLKRIGLHMNLISPF